MTASAVGGSGHTASNSFRWTQLIVGVVCMAMMANLQYGWTYFVGPMAGYLACLQSVALLGGSAASAASSTGANSAAGTALNTAVALSTSAPAFLNAPTNPWGRESVCR